MDLGTQAKKIYTRCKTKKGLINNKKLKKGISVGLGLPGKKRAGGSSLGTNCSSVDVVVHASQ